MFPQKTWLSFCTLLALCLSPSLRADEVLISAAMSLKPALEEIQKYYAKQAQQPQIKLNFAASGVLKQQITEGAPSDIFIAAGIEPIEALSAQLEADRPKPWLKNQLVLAISKGAKPLKNLEELRDKRFKHIAIGEAKTVPAGLYAQDVLKSLKLEESLQAKLVYTHHVRQALTYVEHGEAQAAFVYASDLIDAQDVANGYAIPETLHRPIIYPAAVVKASRAKDAARRVLALLQSAASKKIWIKYGFGVEGPAA